MNSDSVSPGSNPGSPANISLDNQGVPVPDKSDKPEQSADIGRTETGTVGPSYDSQRWALALAEAFHRDQTDKAGFPYILHVVTVAFHVSPGLARIVALLHDIVEDTKCTLEFIRKEFGDEIADAVDAITKRDGESYLAYLNRVRSNDLAREVKYADICDNSSETRMEALDEVDRLRLREKYRLARNVLTA